ncbi:MAG: prepilin-type N-terminal cleavage/methylation domain-containing protein [Candidatus Omnitrophica bacterium]|nr:prepilin-type N-terminal cleavage/methylation domain-containing protein [Candidatus Omnitrophota bacterium]
MSLAGFTLIELLMVMAIIAVLAFVAAAMMVDMPTMRLDMATRKIQSDIRYAQSLAISTQGWTGILFSAANDNYIVYTDGTGATPAGWAVATDPRTRGNYTVQLNANEFEDVDITIVSFNTINFGLIFDKWGNPYGYNIGAGTYSALANPAGVRLSDGTDTTDVRVERGTGRAYIL